MRHKLLVVGCLFVLLISLVPGYLFFKASTGQGEFVMPSRNVNKAEGSVLAVERQDNNNSWSILEELFFARYFYTDLTQIKFAIFYLPASAYIILILGLGIPVNRKILFLFAWGVGLFLICSPTLTPLYTILYKHVFFFKYFRNLHFILWIALLPILCLYLGALLEAFLAWVPVTTRGKHWKLIYILLSHGLVAWCLQYQFYLAATYVTVVLSCLFFLWCHINPDKGRCVFLLVWVFVVAVEPLTVFNYLSHNTKPFHPYAYSYDYIDLNFHFSRYDNDIDMALNDQPVEEEAHDPKGGRYLQSPAAIYYASKWYSYLAGNMDYDILRRYRKNRFILYDQVEPLSEERLDFLAFETSLAENRNVAYISTTDSNAIGSRSSTHHSYYAEIVRENSALFRIKEFNVNRVKIATDFKEEKFLVYNDSFNSQWGVWVDGKKAELYRANIAFKGVWVPPGRHLVEFKFGSSVAGIYLFLFWAINGMFFLTLILWRKDIYEVSAQ